MNVGEPVRHCTRTPDAITSKWPPEIPTKVATKTAKFITYTKTGSRLKDFLVRSCCIANSVSIISTV